MVFYITEQQISLGGLTLFGIVTCYTAMDDMAIFVDE